MRRTTAVLRSVYITGTGVVPVTRKQGATLEGMSAEAVQAALRDTDCDPAAVQGLYVGNMLSGMLSHQQHIGPLVATKAGLSGVDTMTVESCCGAGGGALRLGYMAIKSGLADCVVVAGVEQMTHAAVPDATAALATASHWENEGSHGATFVTLNGTLQDMYTRKYRIGELALAPFSINSHKNATTSPHSVLKKPATLEDYASSRIVNDPIRVLDASPMCDGAAAVVLSSAPPHFGLQRSPVEMIASASASDILTVLDRPEPLSLRAVQQSTERALAMARVERSDVDIFELHDAYAIMACLSLEAAGFAPPGEGWCLAEDGTISLQGKLPIATFGGLKARGHPVGATGVYQVAESFLQLQGWAGENQVPGKPSVAMTQNIGGAGSSVFTHILGL